MLSGVQRFLALPKKQPVLILHYSVNAFLIDLAAVDLLPSPAPSLAISGSIFDNAGNGILLFSLIGLGW
jgi:hypothetical protein